MRLRPSVTGLHFAIQNARLNRGLRPPGTLTGGGIEGPRQRQGAFNTYTFTHLLCDFTYVFVHLYTGLIKAAVEAAVEADEKNTCGP
eukprot:1186358-Pyramimonas_sp.AAC.2